VSKKEIETLKLRLEYTKETAQKAIKKCKEVQEKIKNRKEVENGV